MRDTDKLILVFLALCVVLLWMGSILDREHQPQFAINETYLKEMEAARRMNVDVWLAPNMTENYTITAPDGSNVTIWKGGGVVCYIPNGEVALSGDVSMSGNVSVSDPVYSLAGRYIHV